MLNLKWLQPEAKSLPDTLLLALDDNSMWPRAPLQSEAKLLPDTHLLALNVELKQEGAPVPEPSDTSLQKRFIFLHEKLCLLWKGEATHVKRCAVPIKCLRYPMNKRMFSSEESLPILPSVTLHINRKSLSLSLFTYSNFHPQILCIFSSSSSSCSSSSSSSSSHYISFEP